MHWSRIVPIVLAVTSIAPAATAGQADVTARYGLPRVLTLDGVAGVIPGMRVGEVSRRWGIGLRPRGSRGCTTADINVAGVRGYALFENGRLGAVFFDRGVRTPSGIQIGSTTSALRRAFGDRLSVKPHAYVRGGKYFFLTRKQSPRWQIRFDTNAAKRVTQIAFGARAVHYIEGCS